jgi:hypothetical protein
MAKTTPYFSILNTKTTPYFINSGKDITKFDSTIVNLSLTKDVEKMVKFYLEMVKQ